VLQSSSRAVPAALPCSVPEPFQAAAAIVPPTLQLPVRVQVHRASAEMDAVERLMLELAQAGPDLLGRIAAEHLGGGGKRLRARLSLAAYEALGGEPDRAIGWAAACELLHNATLIHDDLQDGDRVRRGKPTVWARHGGPQAINAGDLMLMLPFLSLAKLEIDAETRWQLTRVLAEGAARVARGQAAEVALSRDEPVDWPAYRAIIAGKTGALFELPVEGAALLAGQTPAAAHAIGLEFQRLGVLFQLQDDVLDLFGDKGRDRVGSDLRAGKVTSLVIEHLEREPADRDWLLDLLATPRESTRETDVWSAISRFHACGALDAVLDRIEAEADALATSASLAAVPALRDLALGLSEEIVGLIAHLTSRGREQASPSSEMAAARAAGGAR
jgi:geranylgeranyl diphosphate synthase, type I